jgi:hypothetical protein
MTLPNGEFHEIRANLNFTESVRHRVIHNIGLVPMSEERRMLFQVFINGVLTKEYSIPVTVDAVLPSELGAPIRNNPQSNQ